MNLLRTTTNPIRHHREPREPTMYQLRTTVNQLRAIMNLIRTYQYPTTSSNQPQIRPGVTAKPPPRENPREPPRTYLESP